MNLQYLLYFLNQLMKKKDDDVGGGGDSGSSWRDFAADETGSKWHRETDIDVLENFCREGYAMAKKHGHFIIGTTDKGNYIGIPGRFLLEEQPAGGNTGFTLWQPLRGGEEMYSSLAAMRAETALQIFGYWIARIDEKTLKISEA